MKVISTEKAPAAIGPYSQGYQAGNIVITSGQLPIVPATGEMPEGIVAQSEASCKNIGAVLEAAGTSFDKVVKTTCFLKDVARDFGAFNEVYAEAMGDAKPARSCVGVADLPKGVLVEVEVIAAL